MKIKVLTRIFRLLHVAQPLDFPGTPTMTRSIFDYGEVLLSEMSQRRFT